MKFSYTVRDIDSGEEVLKGNAQVGDHSSVEINRLPYSQGHKKLYAIQWEADGVKGKNHYLSGNPPFDFNWYKNLMDKM
jgi:hypothetical protein